MCRMNAKRSCFRALLILAIGMILMKFTCALTGLTMYAYYHDCDPLKAKVNDDENP